MVEGITRSSVLHDIDFKKAQEEARAIARGKKITPTPHPCLACVHRRDGPDGSECAVGGSKREVRTQLMIHLEPTTPIEVICPPFKSIKS